MKITMINKTRAQAGNQAAILVIIIAVLLILFLLSISPEEREKLLNDDNGTGNNDDPSFPNSITLLRANPGSIKYVPQDEKIHEFAPFDLNANTKGEIIHTKNSMYLKNSVFEKITDTITFQIDKKITSNLLLNFNIEESSGSLIILLNDETIFHAPIADGNSPPIHLSSSSLREQNKLEFLVSGPGAAFWKYNYYTIKDVNIYADVLDLSRSKSTQVFDIEPQEANEMEQSEIRYLPYCTGDIQDLSIHINNFQIFKGIPDCELFNTKPIPVNYLHEGVNEITFQVQSGEILIDRAKITNSLEKPQKLTYYFEVRDKYFDIVGDEYELKQEYETMLDITFPNNDQKRFEMIINGKPINFNTARLRETRNMRLFLQPGTNSIQVEPKTELAITEIKLRIREK